MRFQIFKPSNLFFNNLFQKKKIISNTGISRSAAIVIAYVMETCDFDFQQVKFLFLEFELDLRVRTTTNDSNSSKFNNQIK